MKEGSRGNEVDGSKAQYMNPLGMEAAGSEGDKKATKKSYHLRSKQKQANKSEIVVRNNKNPLSSGNSGNYEEPSIGTTKFDVGKAINVIEVGPMRTLLKQKGEDCIG